MLRGLQVTVDEPDLASNMIISIASPTAKGHKATDATCCKHTAVPELCLLFSPQHGSLSNNSER